MGHALEDFSAFLLGNTAGNTDQQVRVSDFLLSELAKEAENLLLGLGSNGTGVQQDKIRLFHVKNRSIATGSEKLLHDLGVTLVHLAAKGFYKHTLIHKR